VAQTYNQEANTNYITQLRLGDSDMSFSSGTDANGNSFFQ
jgi:hypothetical protein